MDNTIAFLFCIWVVSEIIDNIKKYKMEKKQHFVVETLSEEFKKLQVKNQELEKDYVFLKSLVNDISDELSEKG